MSLIYYAASQRGYVKKQIQGGVNTDCSKHIPVYKVVNEFMNYQPKQFQKRVIKQVDEEQDNYQLIKSARSLDNASSSKQTVKLIMNSASCKIERLQEDQPNEEQVKKSFINKRQHSLKDTSVSHFDSSNKNNIKVSIIQSQIIKTQNPQKIKDRKDLQQQIQKEKILRKNLQQSYFMLLQRINKNQIRNQIKDIALNKYGFQHHNEYEQLPQSQHTKIRSILRPKSKTEKSIQDNKEDEEQFQDLQDMYCKHLQRQKQFQSTLLEQIANLHEKIESLENSIIQREDDFLKRKRLQKIKISQFKGQINYGKAKMSKISSQQQNSTNVKKQIHNIFLFFIVFLIIAMALKNKQK